MFKLYALFITLLTAELHGGNETAIAQRLSQESVDRYLLYSKLGATALQLEGKQPLNEEQLKKLIRLAQLEMTGKDDSPRLDINSDNKENEPAKCCRIM